MFEVREWKLAGVVRWIVVQENDCWAVASYVRRDDALAEAARLNG